MPAFKRCICINVLGAEILVDLRYMGYIISLNNTSLLIKCLDQVDSGALNVGVSFQRNHKKKLYVAWLFFFFSCHLNTSMFACGRTQQASKLFSTPTSDVDYPDLPASCILKIYCNVWSHIGTMN